MPFRPLRFLLCLFTGHRFMNSHSRPGFVTCVRCRVRKRA